MPAITGAINIYVDNKAEDVPRLLVCKFQPTKKSGLIFLLRPDARKAMVAAVNEQKSIGWYSDGKSDCPLMPSDSAEVPYEQLMKDFAAGVAVSPELAPMTLKSQWQGVCELDGTGFKVRLARKVNPYTVLELESDPAKKRWIYRVHRDQNWHTTAKKEEGQTAFLADAITAVQSLALPVVGEACAVKEMYRRPALDKVYAETHPNKAAAVPKTNPNTSFWAEAQKRAQKALNTAADSAGEGEGTRGRKKQTAEESTTSDKPVTKSKAPAATTPSTRASAGEAKPEATTRATAPKAERPTLAPAPTPSFPKAEGASGKKAGSAAAPKTNQPGGGPVPNAILMNALREQISAAID